MRWTREQFLAYEQRRKNRAGSAGVCADNAQPTQGNALERTAPREDPIWPSFVSRLRIRVTVYSVRPADWDGYDIKELQDMLCKIGVLPDDNWRVLQGEVISEKAHSKEEERTVIEIESL